MGNTIEHRKGAGCHRNHYSVFLVLVIPKRQQDFYLLPILALAEYRFASNGAAGTRDREDINQPPEALGNSVYLQPSSHNADGYVARPLFRIRG
ncbi:hypothetical protein [Dechloromonas sp.]|uniref:hypothetical protein n=1 Tax=Dechloromonas sp. TaxID=1917218 RepID=UPI0021700051|nr:hypothetical protein [Dechloromonas sp.]MBU3696844.1 hypothetical protein [Dechloromonas sp.]